MEIYVEKPHALARESERRREIDRHRAFAHPTLTGQDDDLVPDMGHLLVYRQRPVVARMRTIHLYASVFLGSVSLSIPSRIFHMSRIWSATGLPPYSTMLFPSTCARTTAVS